MGRNFVSLFVNGNLSYCVISTVTKGNPKALSFQQIVQPASHVWTEETQSKCRRGSEK